MRFRKENQRYRGNSSEDIWSTHQAGTASRFDESVWCNIDRPRSPSATRSRHLRSASYTLRRHKLPPRLHTTPCRLARLRLIMNFRKRPGSDTPSWPGSTLTPERPLYGLQMRGRAASFRPARMAVHLKFAQVSKMAARFGWSSILARQAAKLLLKCWKTCRRILAFRCRICQLAVSPLKRNSAAWSTSLATMVAPQEQI